MALMKQEEACFFPHLGSILLQVGLEEDGSDPLPRVMLILSHGFNFPFLNSSHLKFISHFHCIIIRDLIWVIPEWSSGFPDFLQFKSEFGNKEFMI